MKTQPLISGRWLIVTLLFSATLLGLPSLFGQQNGVKSNIPHEKYEGEYIPVSRQSMPVSPAYHFDSPGFWTVQVNVNSDGNNMVGDAANEPSIAVDPTNPDHMVIGWRQFNTVTNSFRQAGNAYTTDGGETWTFPEVIDPGIFRSDPVLDADANGNIYYNSLTVVGEDYLCNVYKSTDGGATWDDGIFAQGGDKQWMTIDKSPDSPGQNNAYAFWTTAYSICPFFDFTRSIDGITSFEDCSLITGEPYWGTLATNAEGDLYVGGAQDNHFVVARSSDVQSGVAVTWDYSVPVSLGGEINGFAGYDSPNPTGIIGQTNIAVDKSDGPLHGNVYLLCSVLRYSPYDPSDIMFSRSTDDGLTWSNPVKINDDFGQEWQWFGTMSVAPNGRIDVVWLDTRDNPGFVYSRLYYSWSFDGGETWADNVALSETFDPHLGWPQQDKMGDYYHMVSDENGANLAWANTFNNEQDVYYARIDNFAVGIRNTEKENTGLLYQNYPNPVNNVTKIRYNITKRTAVSLVVLDMNGNEIERLVSDVRSPGIYSVDFNTSDLKSGIYNYQLTTGNFVENKKMIIIH